MVAELNYNLTQHPEVISRLSQFAMENVSIEIYWVGSDARIYYANNQACKKLGYTKEELTQLSISDLDPNYPISLWPEHWQSLKQIKTQTFETLHQCKNGDTFPVEVVANYVSIDGYEFNVGFAKDISDRKLAESKLKESEYLWKFAIEGAGDGVWDWDFQKDILTFSKRWQQIFGFTDDDDFTLSGNELRDSFHPDDRERVYTEMQAHLEGKTQSYSIESRRRCKDGSYKWVLGRGMVVSRNAEGKPLRMIGTTTDISMRKNAEDEIHRLAFFDALTDLPNRRLLNDRLTQAMAYSKRTNCYGALLFLDLDNFKPLNDTYGHPMGDLLLTEAASRLKNCVRGMDTVARFGGDEFVVILNELGADKADSIVQCRTIAEKICAALSVPYQLKSKETSPDKITVEHRITVSMGVYVFINHKDKQDDILRWADIAMYQAKKFGGNKIHFYETEIAEG
jgi:diguanylate cyclase (GGDEF)-like protein/PAS domain S-box-containing protein